MTPEELSGILRARRYNVTCERELQEAVESILLQASVKFVREYRIGPKDRVDFMVDPGIALELKVGGRPAQLVEQLQRYAMHPDVTSVILMTTRMTHCCMPSTLAGKSVKTLCVLRL